MERVLDLAAGVLGKPLVEQIFERNEIAETFFRVLVVRNGNVADALFRKHELQIVVHHDMLSAKAR